MHKLFAILILLISVSAFSQQLADTNTGYQWEQPKSNIINNNMHQIAGFTIAFTTYGIWYGLTENRIASIILSTGTAWLIGHGKEALDKSKGFRYSHDDVWDTTLGGVGGAITFDILAKRHRKRKAKR